MSENDFFSNSLILKLTHSLFCDFSYNQLSDLRKLKNFKYCLILENYDIFEQEFENKENQTPSLF